MPGRSTATLLRISTLAMAAFLGSCFLAASASAEALTWDQWSLKTGIVDGVAHNTQSSTISAVTNPFVGSDGTAIPPSTANATYQIYWSSASATVRIDGDQRLAGHSDLLSTVTGQIWLTATQDLQVSIAGSFTFALPDGDRQSLLSASIIRVTPFASIWGENHSSFPIAGDPRFGTFNINGSAILPAGSQYPLRYSMRLNSYSGNPSILSAGTGFVQFNITPEPAALTLLLPAAALLPRRRQRNG